MFTIKERKDIRNLVNAAFRCDDNIAFLNACLCKYFADPNIRSLIHESINDLVANYDVEAAMRFADPITNPSVQVILNCINKKFLRDRITFIQDIIIDKAAGRSSETLTTRYILRDGKLKNRKPNARLIGPSHGSDLPSNDYNNGQPRKQFWRYAEDTSHPVDSWFYPKRTDGMRDDSMGEQTYRGSHLPDLAAIKGGDYNVGDLQYKGSGAMPESHQPYEEATYEGDEPIYEYGGNIPDTQSQTNDDGGNDGGSNDIMGGNGEMINAPDNAHHANRLFTSTMNGMNNDTLWEGGDHAASNDLYGDNTAYTNEYNTNNQHGSSVASTRNTSRFEQRKVFRHDNALIDKPISRRYERDIDDTLGGFEHDFQLRKHDMASLHCRHERKPCGPRPFNDPFTHRYKSSTAPYLNLGRRPMYYPADHP